MRVIFLAVLLAVFGQNPAFGQVPSKPPAKDPGRAFPSAAAFSPELLKRLIYESKRDSALWKVRSLLHYGPLFRDAELRGKIELLPEQKKEIDLLLEAGVDRYLKLALDERNVIEPAEGTREFAREVDDQISKVLLSYQIALFNDIMDEKKAKANLADSGLVPALVKGSLADRLKISDSQKRKLKSRTEQIRADWKKRIEAMHQEAIESLLSELNDQQRSELEKLLGIGNQFSVEDVGKFLAQLELVNRS